MNIVFLFFAFIVITLPLAQANQECQPAFNSENKNSENKLSQDRVKITPEEVNKFQKLSRSDIMQNLELYNSEKYAPYFKTEQL